MKERKGVPFMKHRVHIQLGSSSAEKGTKLFIYLRQISSKICTKMSWNDTEIHTPWRL